MAVNVSLPFDFKRKDIVFKRDPDGQTHFNIAQQWVSHSPDGFEWGYAGSGPADFALNILRVFDLDFKLAFLLHHRLERELLVRFPKEGGAIFGGVINAWIGEECATPDIVRWLVSRSFACSNFEEWRELLSEHHPEVTP